MNIQSTGTVETGLSDFYLLIYFMLKTKYTKLPPKKIKYRNYKYFNEDYFLYELNYCLSHTLLKAIMILIIFLIISYKGMHH